jgi:hypothetical protein
MVGRAFLALAFVAVAVVGCSIGSSDVDETTYTYGLFPQTAHSGFNDKAKFRVVFATSAPDPKWSVEDASIATIERIERPKNATTALNISFALATMTKSGETTVTVTSGDTKLSSRLVVKAYSDADIAAGKARYEVGGTEPNRVPCASCHQKPDGVDHSPLKMAGFDDDIILGVVQNATYPPSSTGRAVSSDYAPRGPLSFAEHKWNLTDAEKVGVLAHLRSLPLGGL